MKIWADVQQQIASALPGLAPEDVRVPARKAACDCYAPGLFARPSMTAFGTLYGVPLVESIVLRRDRLLFTLTNAFYTACVEYVNASMPLPEHDCGDHALNRMLAYARQGGRSCPCVPQIQYALWLCAGAGQSPALNELAGRAFLTMLHGETVASRQVLLHACGPLSAACARLYAQRYALSGQTTPFMKGAT